MTGKAFIDLQHDVTRSDIDLAHREGYVSVEHLKRYTTLGMGTDQGRTSNVNGLALMAAHRGVEIPAVGTTTFRLSPTVLNTPGIAIRMISVSIAEIGPDTSHAHHGIATHAITSIKKRNPADAIVS